MAAVPFGTLKLAQALRDKAYFTAGQAEGAAGAIADALKTDLVTKTDPAEAKVDIIKRVAGLAAFQTLAVIGTVLALAHH